MVDLSLVKDLRRSLLAGHPWIYDRALAPAALAPGQLVRVRERRGHPLAVGYADPRSPIRVRVLSRDPSVPADELGPAWAADRARRAAARRRAAHHLSDTSAVRLIHGEGDDLPGLVVNLYDATLVVVTDGAGARAFWRPRLAAVSEALRGAGYTIERLWLRERGGGGQALAGDAPPDRLVVSEGPARFEVNVRQGQKTGLFLDQRDNRRYLASLSSGRTVLNLFGYTGGFSVHAGLAGAARVVTVDQAGPAIEAAGRNLALSGLDPSAHELVRADAFEFLAQAAHRGRRFDVVVCDPPSFAPRQSAVAAARTAYRRLNRLALSVVAPGGLLLTASCSSHFSRADLTQAVAEAALEADRRVLVRTVRGADADHPVLPGFPEGDYLCLLDCHVE